MTNTCSRCRTVFRVLADEDGDHLCPKCGWHPSQDEPKKPYLLDGNTATASEIIGQAQEFGYTGDGGIFLLSEAAKWCRQHGWRVEENTMGG